MYANWYISKEKSVSLGKSHVLNAEHRTSKRCSEMQSLKRNQRSSKKAKYKSKHYKAASSPCAALPEALH